MDNYKVPAYPVSRADIIRDGGYYDVNGLWNSIRVLGDGYLVRHRVETFIFRETSDNRLEVFLRMYNDGTYRLPGGSTTKGVSDKVQAILECQEEARIKVKDIEYTGVHYVKMNTKKLNNNDPNLVHWDGSYNDVYAGFYNGPYNGEVKDLDQDNDMYKNGKFYIIDDELLSHIIPEHKPIFDRLKQVGILEDTEVDNGSKEDTSTVDDKAIELCVFAGNFLTRCVDNTVSINIVPHKKMEDMYAVASYQCYSEENMLKFIALLNELNNTTVMRERYKDDNFGVIIPSKDAYNGTLYLKSGITSVSENAALHDDKDPIFTVKPEEDWLDTVLQQDDSPEHRKKLADLGIEPDSDLPIGEATMIAERIISSCTEGIISVNEKYIFSEKDGFYNFDKWESGESNILLITGLSGSGKTTKAKALMKQYNAKYIQLDEFQCYNNNKGKKDSTTSRLISIYLKENPHPLDPAKFTELTAEDFPDYFDPFFDWLIERLSSDQDNRYIIEGLHICLYVPYNTIREYPLYCINTSMTKSIIRHWVRDGWSFRDFLKHGLADIDLFKEWEKQYSSFKDSIDESYIEEGIMRDKVVPVIGSIYNLKINMTNTDNYIKNKIYLSSFEAIKVNKQNLDKIKDQYGEDDFDPETWCKYSDGIIYMDGDKFVALVLVTKAEKQIIKISTKSDYVKTGLYEQLVEAAVLDLGAMRVISSSGKRGKSDFDAYLKHGFSITKYLNSSTVEMAQTKFKNGVASNTYPVYIVTTYSNSTVSNIIATHTHSLYSHALLAFDPALTKMYSFGKITDDAGRKTSDGFVIDNINNYKKNKCPMQVNCIFIPKNKYNKLLDIINKRIEDKDISSYNYKNITRFVTKNNDDNLERSHNKEMCSTFIADSFDQIGIKLVDKPIDETSPKDLADLAYGNNTVYRLFFGTTNNYSTSKITKRLLNISNKAIVVKESYIEEKSEEYGLPEKKKYPMPDKKHVYSAIKFFNYVDKEDEKELAENIKKKMKQYKIDSSHVGENNRLKNYL